MEIHKIEYALPSKNTTLREALHMQTKPTCFNSTANN